MATCRLTTSMCSGLAVNENEAPSVRLHSFAMASNTPIRIRGKRGAPMEVKWHSGKKRKFTPAGSATASEWSSSNRSTPSTEGSVSRQRRRKQRDFDLLQDPVIKAGRRHTIWEARKMR